MATSTLNPNAPMFVPLAYRAVEDFSDQWWDLVRSSPSFRDYWLRECFSDPQNDLPFFDFSNYALPDFDFVTGDDAVSNISDKGVEKKSNKDLVSVEVLKWQQARVGAELPRYAEKAPKFVKVKGVPKLIQQPR